jgi:hypothetical protein
MYGHLICTIDTVYTAGKGVTRCRDLPESSVTVQIIWDPRCNLARATPDINVK